MPCFIHDPKPLLGYGDRSLRTQNPRSKPPLRAMAAQKAVRSEATYTLLERTDDDDGNGNHVGTVDVELWRSREGDEVGQQ